MPPPSRYDIVGLDWDDQNELHIEKHIDPWLIHEMIQGGAWVSFRNYPNNPPEHWLLIGRTPAGIAVTAVLREPSNDRPGVWRPITG